MTYILTLLAILAILYFANKKTNRFIAFNKAINNFTKSQIEINKKIAIYSFYSFSIIFILVIVTYIVSIL